MCARLNLQQSHESVGEIMYKSYNMYFLFGENEQCYLACKLAQITRHT